MSVASESTVTADTADGAEAPSPSTRVERPRTPPLVYLERYGLLIIFALILIVFSVVSSGFFTLNNFRIVLGSEAVLGILALASIVPLICGQFDLSVGANMGVSGIVLGTCMSRFGLSLAPAIVIALASGLVIGLVNGFFVSRLGVNSFIVTLAMSTFLAGMVQWYTNGATISTGIPQSLITASTGDLLGIPKGVFWLVPVAVVAWYVLEHTPYGRYLTSIGSNRKAAELVGLRVNRLTYSSFLVSGVLAALAGILTVGQAGDADPQVVQGALLLAALAAAFLGSSAFKPGRFNVPGTVLAVYFVAFSVSGLEFLGAASWVSEVFDGAALAGAVSVTTLIARKNSTK